VKWPKLARPEKGYDDKPPRSRRFLLLKLQEREEQTAARQGCLHDAVYSARLPTLFAREERDGKARVLLHVPSFQSRQRGQIEESDPAAHDFHAQIPTEALVREGVMSSKKRLAAFRPGPSGGVRRPLVRVPGRNYPCSSEEEKIENCAQHPDEGLVVLQATGALTLRSCQCRLLGCHLAVRSPQTEPACRSHHP